MEGSAFAVVAQAPLVQRVAVIPLPSVMVKMGSTAGRMIFFQRSARPVDFGACDGGASPRPKWTRMSLEEISCLR